MKNVYSILSFILLFISVSVIGQTKIYAPSLRAPENISIGQMPDVVLDWDAVTGVSIEILYELQLANNPEFVDAVTFAKTNVTAEVMSDLLFGNKYYWRVRAFDGDDVSGWSETWSFDITWTVPNLEVDEEVFVNPVVEWDSLSGVIQYELQLDTVYSWSAIESGTEEDINASFVIDENNMWAVGNSGLILFSDGSGWVTSESGITEDLNAVFFIDATNGYAVGNGGVTLFFDGTSWTSIDLGTTEDLLGLSFSDINNGVVVGNNGTVVMYNTGAWELVTTGDDNDLYAVDMLSTSSIWACGSGKILVKYNGTDWTAEEVGTKDHYGIAMINENNGWMVGKSGRVNGWNGTDWSEIVKVDNSTKHLNSVSFTGLYGVAVGDDGTMITFDGTWTKAVTLVDGDLNGVMISGDYGIVVGVDGTIIKKAGSDFNSPLLTSYYIDAVDHSIELSDLLFGQNYFVRLRTMHSLDTSVWTGVKTFYTINSPTLDSPSSSDVTDLLVEFKWDEYEGITNYIFEIANNESFEDATEFSPEEDTLVVADLAYGTEYFWRVAAQHALAISDWSEVWTINTVNSVTLIKPANSADDVAACPAYSWEEIIGTSKYEILLDTDPAFSNPFEFTSDKASYQCQSKLENEVTYYWKVRGTVGVNVSEWSEVWSFTTEASIGFDEIFSVNDVSLFPNPSNGKFDLSISSNTNSTYELSMVDITGKMIYNSSINCNVGNNIISLNIENLKSGIYNLLISDNTNSVTKRVLIK